MEKKCPTCGEPVGARMRFCPNCGQPLPTEKNGERAQEPAGDAALPLIKQDPAEDVSLPLIKQERTDDASLPLIKQDPAAEQALPFVKQEEATAAPQPFLKQQENTASQQTEESALLRKMRESAEDDFSGFETSATREKTETKQTVAGQEEESLMMETTEQQAQASVKLRFCSHCGKELVPGAPRCAFCGKPVAEMLPRHMASVQSWQNAAGGAEDASGEAANSFEEAARHFSWQMPEGAMQEKVHYLLRRVFNPYGRANRGTYIVNSIVCTIFSQIVAAFLNGTDSLFVALFGLVYSVLAMGYSVCLVIRRFHDLNMSGWRWFAMLIPFYNIYLLVKLVFFRGTTGANRFGDDPLTAAHWLI